MGKMTNKDDGRGKLTYPNLLGVEASENRASELIDAAVASLESFGASADPLRELAKYVLERTH